MKILHTADWHIGKRFNSVDYLEDFIFFKNELVTLVKDNKIDIILVSGDVFDVYSPNTSAQEVYYETIHELAEISCVKHIFITAGNHDSASWLQAPKVFLQKANIHVIGAAKTPSEAWFTISENDEIVNIAAVPFLRQSDFPELASSDSYSTIKEKNARGLIQYYNDVFEHRPTSGINVAMGHFTCVSDYSIDSEREISIGHIDGTNKNDLPEFDYFALGHIHKPITVSASKNIYYSGSPYPMSFSERDDEKRVLIFDSESKEIESVGLKTYRKFVQLEGKTVEEIEEQLKSILAPEKVRHVFLQFELKLISDEDVVVKHKELLDLRTRYNDEFIENGRPLFIEKVTISSDQKLESETNLSKPEISGELISPEDLVDQILDGNQDSFGQRRDEMKEAFAIILQNLNQA